MAVMAAAKAGLSSAPQVTVCADALSAVLPAADRVMLVGLA